MKNGKIKLKICEINTDNDYGLSPDEIGDIHEYLSSLRTVDNISILRITTAYRIGKTRAIEKYVK